MAPLMISLTFSRTCGEGKEGTAVRWSPDGTGSGSPRHPFPHPPPRYLIGEDEAQRTGCQLQEEDDGQADGELWARGVRQWRGHGREAPVPRWRGGHRPRGLTACSRGMFSRKEPTQPQKVMRKVRTPTTTSKTAGSTARQPMAASATASRHRSPQPADPTPPPGTGALVNRAGTPHLTCVLQQPGVDPHRHHHHRDHLRSRTGRASPLPQFPLVTPVRTWLASRVRQSPRRVPTSPGGCDLRPQRLQVAGPGDGGCGK